MPATPVPRPEIEYNAAMRRALSSLTSPLALLVPLGALLIACGDNNEVNRPVDAGSSDTATPDAADPDGGAPDAAPPDAAETDAATPDAAQPDAAMPDAAMPDAAQTDASSAPMTSAEITAARATADGTGLSLPITFATVTYLKPFVGGSPTNDPVGFTIQAEQPGPALYIAVDPSMTTPTLAVGDVVSFTITGLTTVNGLKAASAITGLTRSATGVDVNPLVQNLTTATDVVTALDSYESELVDVVGTATGAFTAAGTSFTKVQLVTTGVPADTLNKLRLPTTLRDSIDLVTGCQVSVNNTPVGRNGTEAQYTALFAADLTISGCPAPTVSSAASSSATQVVLTFSRNIAPASVLANGSQFTFDNGLTASAATVSGRTVTVTTSAQTGGAAYLATVASSVTDLQGTALGTPSTATFNGFQVPAVVRINEFNANVTAGSCDMIELRVVSGGSMTGFVLRERDTQTLLTFPAFSVATNDLIVVHINNTATCNPGSAVNETTAPNAQLAATFTRNYDTAYDFYSSDAGLTNTDNVFTLFDGLGNIVDVVFTADAASGLAAAATETAAATAVATAPGAWNIAGMPGVHPAGGYVDDNFRMNAALDLNDAATTLYTGSSIQRLDNTDDNDKDDWNSATITVQPNTWGALNVGQTPF